MKTATLKAWLSVLALFGFLGCLFILFFVEIPTASRDVLLVMIGALVTTVKDIYGYFFGSSAGSERKTELLANSPPGPGFVAAELKPFSPADAVTGDGGFLRFSLRGYCSLFIVMVLLALAGLTLTGCAGKTHQETAAITLLTTQQAVVTAAEIGDALCKSKQLEATKCAAMRDAYGKAGKAYDLAADALILAVRSGDAAGLDRYTLFERQFSTLATDFLSLAVEFNVIPTPGGAK